MNTAQFENEELETAFLKFKEDWNQNNSVEIFSSGSTGEPKKILISKDQMVLSASKTIQFFKLKEGIKALVCLSLDTIAGKMMLARSFLGKWDLKIIEPSINPLKNLDEYFDFAALVPMQLERILKETPEKIKQLKTIIVGGAPVSDDLTNLLKDHRITVFQTFGMTETISHIALRKIGLETELFYQTVDGVEVSDNEGDLIIHYPEMFQEPLKTNDVVKIRSSKQFQWLGRSDFVINSGGVKLNPEIIEQKLSEYIPVSFFITGLSDTKLGQKLALVIENPLDYIPNKSPLFKILEKYEIPKVFAVVHMLDRTKSGKINRYKTLKKINFNDWKELV
jgi:O-succinylbenzoic acid--CoA ligase